jgi:hypothetical protein
MDKGTKEITDLLDELSEAGWVCVKNGTRYRCTGPKGQGPAWVPQRITKTGSINAVRAGLAKAGYRPDGDTDGEVYVPQHADGPALDGPTTEARLLSADDAADLLDLNVFHTPASAGGTNRPFNEAYARHLAAEMLAGRWHLTHQGVAVGTDGKLVDGQHRLSAIVYAAEMEPTIRIPMMVTTGVDPATFLAVDTGRKRTAADMLGIQGHKNRTTLAAVLKLIYCWDTTRNGSWHKVTVSNELLEQVYVAHPGASASTEVAQQLSKGARLLPGAAGLAHYVVESAQVTQIGHDLHDRFVTGLATGASLPDGDPRLALRNTIANLRASRRAMNAQMHVAMYIKAWNLWVAERTRQTIAWRDNESMPEPTVIR